MRLITTNPEVLERALPVLKKADLVPNIVGKSGIGKSQIVQQFVKKVRDASGMDESEFGFLLSIQSIKDPVDNRGVPDIDRDAHLTRWYAPADQPVEGNNSLPERGIEFHDELDRCDPANLNTLLTRLSARMIDNRRIKPGWWDVCAMNGSSDEYTTPLPKALRKRLCHLYFHHNDISPLVQHASSLSWNESVVGYLATEKPLPCEPDWEDLAVDVKPDGEPDDPPGRAFEYLSRAEDSLNRDWPFAVHDLRPVIVQGLIGYVHMLKYMAFRANEDLPSHSEIVQNPSGAPIPKTFPGMYGVASILGAQANQQYLSAYDTYLSRIANISPEIAVYGYRAAAEKVPSLLSCATFARLHNDSQG